MWPTQACGPPHPTRDRKIRQLVQPRTIVFNVAIYCIVVWRLRHVRAVCSVDLHILHLRSARCGRSAAASAVASSCLVWAACVWEALSAPDKTPHPAIYMCRCAFFFFWRRFSMRNFSFSLASSAALNIAILHPLISWLRAYSVRLSGLCVYCLRQRLSRAIRYYSLVILWVFWLSRMHLIIDNIGVIVSNI